MGPHADFACLSRKCQQDGNAPVYDLPVGATRCAVCGSKRIRRLYNAVNVSESGFFSKNRFVDQVGAEAFERKHDQDAARITALKRGCPQIAVPIGRRGEGIGQALARIHPAFGVVPPSQDGSRPVAPGFAHPVAGEVRGRPPRPGPGSVNLGGKMEEAG